MQGKNLIRIPWILIGRLIDAVLLWFTASMILLFSGICLGYTDGTGITSPVVYRILLLLFLISAVVRTIFEYQRLKKVCAEEKQEFVVERTGEYQPGQMMEMDREVSVKRIVQDVVKSLPGVLLIFAAALVLMGVIAAGGSMIPGWISVLLCVVVFVAAAVLANKKLYGEIALYHCVKCRQIGREIFLDRKDIVKYTKDIVKHDSYTQHDTRTKYHAEYDDITQRWESVAEDVETGTGTYYSCTTTYHDVRYGNHESRFQCACCGLITRGVFENVCLDDLKDVWTTVEEADPQLFGYK